MSRFDLLQFEDAQQMFERRAKEAESRKNKLAKIEKIGYCEGFAGPCYCRKDVIWVEAMTCYLWDKEKDPEEDPNRQIFLCPQCDTYYVEHWQEMWDDYNDGR